MTTNGFTTQPNALFDPLAELARGRSTARRRHLTFGEQCGIYAGRDQASAQELARAFNVSAATISQIRNPRPNQYGRILRELEQLGQTQFDRRYYTEEIHTRIMREKHSNPTK